MGDSANSSKTGGKLDDSNGVELTGKIMVASIITVFFVLLTVFLIHLLANSLRRRRPDSNGRPTTAQRRRRFYFSAGYQEETNSPALPKGLDPSVLKTIPIVKYSTKDYKNALECAVCLSDVSEGENARILPKCNHGFHVNCIDKWFQSHSTCPLCRNPISNSTLDTTQRAEDNSVSAETNNLPLGPCLQEPRKGPISTQLHCSSSTSLAEGAKGSIPFALPIDIPREIVEGDEEEQKSPVGTRMQTLRRLLSRGKRVTPSSPSGYLDLEQGGRSQSS